MSEITLASRELTFADMEFQEADITSKDKLQNIINEVIEGGESHSTAHMILGSIDYDNKENPNEGGSLFDINTSLPRGFLLPNKPGSKTLKRYKNRPKHSLDS